MSEPIEFAAHLLPLRSGASHEERDEHNRRMLLSALNLGTAVAFIGSGVSRAFGYPAWAGLAQGVIDLAIQVVEDEAFQADLQSLRPAEKQNLCSTELMFLIGFCKEKLQEKGLLNLYHCYLQNHFAPRLERAKDPDDPLDPFTPLLNLPIRRFATSNYDCEIELALHRKKGIPLGEFGIDKRLKSLRPCPGTCKRSFTQRKESLHQLALLSLAGTADNEDMVFHCHGRFDDPDSIIATENDYQRWYLGTEDGASLAYQQAIQLMLGSNPVLFVGYGMRDDDMLRPLRALVTLDRERSTTRPIFALFAEPQKIDDRLHQAALYDRYGLNVVSYPGAPEDATSERHTEALCEALAKLCKDWQDAHRDWLRKPKLKKAKIPDKKGKEATPEEKPKAYWDIRMEPRIKPVRQDQLIRSISHPGIVVLWGPSGSGKSSLAVDLVNRGAKGDHEVGDFHKLFYWNAHYANETVTAVDYVLSFLDPDGECQGEPYERIRECLVGRRNLLILDGFERLLCKGSLPDSGWAYSANLRRLLHVFVDRSTQSTVVLVGRLRPADLQDLQVEKDGMPLIREVLVQRAESRKLIDAEPFKGLGLDHGSFSALCSLLRGHCYGLELAYHHLAAGALERAQENLCKLNDDLADRLPDLRLREMMRIVLKDLDAEHGEILKAGSMRKKQLQGLASEFLQRLGLFLNPICRRTVLNCYEEAWKAIADRERKKTGVQDAWMNRTGETLEQEASSLYCKLVDRGILLPTRPHGEEGSIEGYTLHCTARRLLFQPDQGQAADPLPALGLSGFTSGRLGVAPDSSQCRQSREIFDRLIDDARSCQEGPASHRARQLCRDAFGLLRTRMETNTAPRWSDYERYLHYGLELIHLVKRVSPGYWTFCEHWDAESHAVDEKSPLFAAELAWLYNDTALALSGGGHVHEACSLWEQAYEISRLLEDPRRGGGFHLEVLINLTFNFIETGYLPAAKGYLDEADQLLHDSRDDDYVGRIQGLRGLMQHLRGNLQGACDFYDECLDHLRRGHNLRAQSIFLKHKADIKIVMGECEEANLLIRSSQSIAGAGVFPELVANARMSEGHRLFRQKEEKRARMEYDAVLRDARRMKAPKLESRALTALARLALEQRELQQAHDYAVQSLSLANQLGLGLRQAHSLVVLGLVTLEEGQRDLGVAYLRHAKRLADKQEYWARSREAEDKLLELDVDPNGTEYPPKSVTGMRK